MPEKTYLITPGPTPVPPEVQAALARPVLHHRTPEFRRLFAETVEGLRRVFATAGDVLVIPGSGTYAMESAVVNLLSPGLLDVGLAQMLPRHRIAEYRSQASLGRLGTAREVAEIAAFLVSDDNSFMAAAKIVADGGL